MANTYKRKRIINLDDLDREQARLRKKTNNIEHEWADMLDPQQLAVTFLSNYFGKKLKNKWSNATTSVKRKKEATTIATDEKKEKKRKSSFKKGIKLIGISIVISFALRKLVQALQNHKKLQ